MTAPRGRFLALAVLALACGARADEPVKRPELKTVRALLVIDTSSNLAASVKHDRTNMKVLLEEYVPAGSGFEERLVGLWETVLGIDTPGVLDSLFDHGVDSLGAARLSRAIADEFGRAIPVSQILFGSDFPYREAKAAGDGLAAWGFSPAEQASIDHETALRLLPHLAG